LKFGNIRQITQNRNDSSKKLLRIALLINTLINDTTIASKNFPFEVLKKSLKIKPQHGNDSSRKLRRIDYKIKG